MRTLRGKWCHNYIICFSTWISQFLLWFLTSGINHQGGVKLLCRAKLLARIWFFTPRNILKFLFYFHLRLISPFLYCCCQEPLDPFRLAGPDTMQTNNSGIETDIASLSAICTPLAPFRLSSPSSSRSSSSISLSFHY